MYKRRNGANEAGTLKCFLKSYLGICYDLRYFELDTTELTIRYAKSEDKIDDEDAYVEQIRNVKGVYKNMVTMAAKGKGGEVEHTRLSTSDPKAKIDRGPDNNGVLYHAFEIETIERTLTLYTQEVDLMEKFVYYLTIML